VSQDNENKPDDLDFNSNEENVGDGIAEIFPENLFNPVLSDEDGSLQNGTELPANTDPSFSLMSGLSEGLGEVSSIFQTNESEETVSVENSDEHSAENSETTDPAEININTDKKSSETKENKEDKERNVQPKKKGEPLELGDKLCLTLSGLLLLALISANVIMLMFPPYEEFGVSLSATMYYLMGVDLIGGVGIVAVPFLFYKFRKENDLFQTLLGVSVMALSFAVLILLTEWFRYDFTSKPDSVLPTIAPVVLSNTAPAE
jgi:hypothetical protein